MLIAGFLFFSGTGEEGGAGGAGFDSDIIGRVWVMLPGLQGFENFCVSHLKTIR